jgi:phosphosulfolactate synthase (CoM biosynthesis protein A)
MAKKAKAASKVVGTTIDAMIKEGKALGRIWSTLHNVKQSTKANGFDTRLGKLLVELKAQSSLDSGQISRQTLTTHGIHNIDRRRRSEALWFVENEVKCREFMQASKKGFTSLTALQKAMRDAAAKADEVSNVGQSNVVNDTGWQEPKAKQSGATEQRSVTVHITRTKMVDTIVKQCELNNLDLETIINDLQQQLAKQAKKEAK